MPSLPRKPAALHRSIAPTDSAATNADGEGFGRPFARRRRRPTIDPAHYVVDAKQLERRICFSAAPIDMDVDAESEQTFDETPDLLQALIDDAESQGTEPLLLDESFNASGDPLAAIIDFGGDQAAQRISRELVLIDANIDDIQSLVVDLLDAAAPDREIDYVIFDNEDSIAAISEVLRTYDDLDAVHLVTHGSKAEINLGNVALNASNLFRYEAEIRAWGQALTENGDLLIYGCDVGQDAQGSELLQSLAELCNCDVTASSDATGSAALGGDWQFEVTTGDVESTVVFSNALQTTWNAVLATPTAEPDVYQLESGSVLSTVGTDQWHAEGWRQRQSLTFNNLAQSENLVDFPVLITLDSSRIGYERTQDDGGDLRFFDSDGATLDYEIESWDETGESYVWVRIPQIDANSNADAIWMYYDNAEATDGQSASGVWNSDFAGVYHLDDDSADSTANANDGVNNGGENQPSAVVAGGELFRQSADTIDVLSAASNTDIFAGGGTVSAWIFADDWGGQGFGRIVDKASQATGNRDGWAFEVREISDSLYFQYGFTTSHGSWTSGDNSINLGEWTHVAVVFDSSAASNDPLLYINGNPAAVDETFGPSVPPVPTRLSSCRSAITMAPTDTLMAS